MLKKNSRLIAVFDYFFLLRPIVLIPIWFFFLIGRWHSDQLETGTLSILYYPDLKTLAAFFLYSLIGGGIYVINQIYDRETDRINRKLFLLADGHISVKSAWIYTFVLYATSLIISLFYSRDFYVFIVLSIILGFLYSMPPFHFKGRPFLDMFSNMVGNGFLNLGAGFLIYSSFTGGRLFSITLPSMLATGAVYLATTIADIEGDKKAGDTTSGVLLGVRNTGILALFMMIITIIISYHQRNFVAFIPSILSLPFFINAVISARISHFLQSARVCTALISLAIGIFFPWFVLFLFAIVMLSRWYYKFRFDLVYPKIFTKDSQ